MAAIRPVGGICGSNVDSSDGETLGSISELMIDSERGVVVYAVLAYGGMLGVGEKLFAVPWNAFEIDVTSGDLRLGVERAKLDDLPGFDKDAWPTAPDPAF